MLSFISGMLTGAIGVVLALIVFCGWAICSAQKRFDSDWRAGR